MATPAEKLAASLAVLADLQQDGRRVFQSGELTRTHRERLLENGFLREVTCHFAEERDVVHAVT